MRVSTAEAKYQPEDGSNGSLTLTITDLGTLRGMAMMGYATWLNMELDRESDTGYERTTKYKGHPAYEKFDRGGSNSRGELSVLVGRRFIVKVEGRGVKMERIKGAMEKIDLGKLDDMKSVGIK